MEGNKELERVKVWNETHEKKMEIECCCRQKFQNA